eukprot:scaffold667036_cov56-Prasinocladus_malaysianus.AAC.1
MKQRENNYMYIEEAELEYQGGKVFVSAQCPNLIVWQTYCKTFSALCAFAMGLPFFVLCAYFWLQWPQIFYLSAQISVWLAKRFESDTHPVVWSDRMVVVTDLQGVKRYDHKEKRMVYTITDPVVMTDDGGVFGDEDLGTEGIKNRFVHHNCNELC